MCRKQGFAKQGTFLSGQWIQESERTETGEKRGTEGEGEGDKKRGLVRLEQKASLRGINRVQTELQATGCENLNVAYSEGKEGRAKAAGNETKKM